MDEEISQERISQPKDDFPLPQVESHDAQTADIQQPNSSPRHDEPEYLPGDGMIQPNLEESNAAEDVKMHEEERLIEIAGDARFSNGIITSQKTLNLAGEHEAEDPGAKAKVKRKRNAELSEKYNFRKDNLAQNQNYDLRTQVKSNKRLAYLTKINKEFVANSKAKIKPKVHEVPKMHEVPKITTLSEAERKPEEQKSQYWQDIDQSYFRKPSAQETLQLDRTEFEDAFEVPDDKINPVQYPKWHFAFNGSVQELSKKILPNSIHFFSFIEGCPSYFRTLQNKEQIHVLWSCKDEKFNKLDYLTSYAPNNIKTKVLETIKRAETPTISTFDVFSGTESEKLQHFKRDVLENTQKHEIAKGDFQSLDRSRVGQLLHLKSVEQISNHDMKEIVSRQMFQNEYGEDLNLQKLHQEDEILEELLFLNYYVNGVLIPQNNAKKEAVKSRVITEENRSSRFKKLQERAKQLESELRFKAIVANLRDGLRDKLPPKTKESGHKIHAQKKLQRLQTSLPKATEMLKEDKNMKNICQNLENRFQNSLKGIIRKGQKLETDCSICFSSKFCDENSIYYCRKCDSSFHQYCYAIYSIPDEDFLCHQCTAAKNKAKRRKKSLKNKNAIKPSGQKMISYSCRLCTSTGFPLQKFRKDEWYHITCLLAHRLVTFKNCEFVTSNPDEIEALIKDNTTKNRRCIICKKMKGLCFPCAAELNGSKCSCSFHPLCAYIEGFYIELTEQDKKISTLPREQFFKIYCNEHCPTPQRDQMRQKYYRRYAINYEHTIKYKSFEKFITKTREKEENEKETGDQQTKCTVEEKNSNNNTTIGIKIRLRIQDDHLEELCEDSREFELLNHGSTPSKMVKK